MITRRSLLATAALPALPDGAQAAELPQALSVFVPAAPGGGWDGLGRSSSSPAEPGW